MDLLSGGVDTSSAKKTFDNACDNTDENLYNNINENESDLDNNNSFLESPVNPNGKPYNKIKITVRTPNDKKFKYSEAEKLYNSARKKLEYDNFSDVIKRTLFFSFYDDKNNLISCIYFYPKEKDKLFLNAFASRNHHILNLICFQMSLSWFNCDIYAHSTEKTAVLCLLKCGFEKIDNDLYIYRRK